jgi:pimeloyl-ACP methyl ester carboxylesterase
MKRWPLLAILVTPLWALPPAGAEDAPPGKAADRMVDAGGHTLHMRIGGQGPATVVLEGGFDAPLSSWDKVHGEVARFARVVSYSRAGIGSSQPGPKPRTARQIATELHTALGKAGLKPPYVLVGHSAGYLYLRLFAHLYPDDVAGLVLVDPAVEDFYPWFKKNRPDAWEAMVEEAKGGPKGLQDQLEALETTLEQVRAARPLPKVPVTVLTATKPWPPVMTKETLEVWLRMHKEFVGSVPGARHVVTDRSDHNMPGNQPGLIVDAIKGLIESKGPGTGQK